MTRAPSPQELTLLSRATVLHQNGDIAQARAVYREVLARRPNDPDLLRLLGTAEMQLGDHGQAVALLSQSLAIAPNQPGALYNLATALRALGRLDECVASYDEALRLKPDYADAYNNRGNVLAALKRFDEALVSYDLAVALKPETVQTYVNRAIALRALGRLEAAAACYRKAIVLHPQSAAAHSGLAGIYEEQGDNERAVVQWSRMAEQLSAGTERDRSQLLAALNNMTRILADKLRDDAGAEKVARQSLRLDPTQEQAATDFINARQRQCAWPVIEPFDEVSRRTILQGLSPLATCLHTDDPMLQLAVSARRSATKSGSDPTHRQPKSLAGPRLRVGYLSSDLRDHAIGHLMYEIPALHDRSRVEAFAYYCGPPTQDVVHQHYRDAFEHFVDISDLGAEAAAQRIADDGVQILIDINGHTMHNRKAVLARRPAPVIVNWLGFPGTMGSVYHHYILADEWTIPPQHEVFFSEQVLELPCYQPNNRRRFVAETIATRSSVGLPQDAFVFCCFIDTEKISRHTFDRWLTILDRTSKSVLWLLSVSGAVRDNLRAYASRKGIDPKRIIFADKAPNASHLARYQLADLFLDTTPYGAHITCSDALWLGVPVITLSGRSFASRVCGSLLMQAGLPDLVFTHADDFIDEAVAIAKDPARLRRYRERLRRVRETSTLFDTPGLVKSLEGLYEKMWRACVEETLPTPDLANMDSYLAVGLELDHKDVEMQSVEDYEAFWRERMSTWAQAHAMVADARFCSHLGASPAGSLN